MGGVALEEVTLEANPSRREAPDWRGLRAAGVTRISLGVQSLRDDDLHALARGHSAEEAREAFAAAREAGFDNVSIDLIYGIPGQSAGDWAAGLEAAIGLGPDPPQLLRAPAGAGPRTSGPRRRGLARCAGGTRMVARQDDGLAAEQYRLAEELLEAAGYRALRAQLVGAARA